MTFEIFVGISFSSLLLFFGHGDIEKVSYTAQRQTDPSLKFFFLKQLSLETLTGRPLNIVSK